MNTSLRYRIVATIIITFITFTSLSFGFFVAPSRTTGNEIYWTLKIITLFWIILALGSFWITRKSFFKLAPISLIATIVQIIPELCRIGYKGENPQVPTFIIVICIVSLSILFVVSIVIAIIKFKGTFKKQN